MTAPLVSVIVPVFNREAVIGQAVASLASQTISDLEIIVVDDGSTDGSAEVAVRAGGGRVRIIPHPRNLGIPAARNTGLEAARGTYVAWLDSDDLARPRRLEEQIRFLDTHPDIALVGSSAGRIDSEGRRKIGVRVPFRSHETLAASLIFRSPFQQSTVSGRATVLKSYSYDPSFPVCEDLDMFIRIARHHRVANLKSALVDRRIHKNQVGRTEEALVRDRKRVLLAALLDQLGVERTCEELDRHISLGTPKKQPPSPETINWAAKWFERLLAANVRSRQYDQRAMASVCARTWIAACFAGLSGWNSIAVGRALATSGLTLGLLNGDGLEWAASFVSALFN